MMKLKNKITKKFLAILTLGLAGLGTGISATVPFILKKWRTIQYSVVDLKQNFESSTDTSVNFTFNFSDEDEYKLNYQDINVSLEDEQGKIVQRGIAKYDAGRWNFNSLTNQYLSAGQKYRVLLETSIKNVGKQKEELKFIDGIKDYVITKANVVKFDYLEENKTATTQTIEVTFADSVNSLAGKKAVLKYYYVNNDNSIKNDQTKIPASQSVKIENSKAKFLLTGLQSSKKYVIESVMYLDQRENNGAINEQTIDIPLDKTKLNKSFNSFDTKKVELEVHKIEKVNFDENSGSLVVGFLKSNNEPDANFNGKNVTLEYKNLRTNEVKTIDSTVEQNNTIFEFNKTKNPLNVGTDYEIISLKDKDLVINFSEKITSKFFRTKVGISSVNFSDIKNKSANIEITINSSKYIPDDNETFNLDESKLEIAIEPTGDGSISQVPLTKKSEGVYVAKFTISKLQSGYTYNINRATIFLKDQPETEPGIKLNTKNTFFTTKTKDIDIFIKGETRIDFRNEKDNEKDKEIEKEKNSINVETDKAQVLVGFDPENSFLNNKMLVLTYKQVNPSLKQEVILTSKAQPQINSAKFKLSPLQPGTTYELCDIEIEGEPTTKLKLWKKEDKTDTAKDKQFTTLSRISKFIFSNQNDTSVDVKVQIADATKTMFKDENNQALKRQARIIYHAIKNGKPISGPISSNWEHINEEDNTISYNLTDLARGTEYQVINLELKPILSTFYDKNIATIPSNTFKTTAKNIEIKNLVSVGNTTATTASFKVSFDIYKNPFATKRNIKINIEDKEGNLNSFNSEVDDSGFAEFNLENLNYGSYYKVSSFEFVDLNTQILWPENNLNIEKNRIFYTQAAVSAISNEGGIAEYTSDLLITIKNSNPDFKFENKTLKVTYFTLEGVSSSDSVVINSQTENNQYLIKMKNLDKNSKFIVDAIYLDGQLIVKTKELELNKEANIFKTSAETANIIAFHQVSNTENSIDFQIDFDPDKDAFMDGKKVSLTLKEQNRQLEESQLDSKTIEAVVSNSSLVFKATNLKEGTRYSILPPKVLNEDGTFNDELTIIRNENLVSNNTYFIYTKPLISRFEFHKITEIGAEVRIVFQDSESEFGRNNTKIKFELLNLETNQPATIEDPKRVVTENGYIAVLSDLNKFTKYRILTVYAQKDSSSEWIEVETKNTISDEDKTFSTIINQVNVKNIEISQISKNSAKVKFYFSDEDWFVQGRNAKLQYKTNSEAKPTSTLPVEIISKYGDLFVEFELNNLKEGTTYQLKNILIDNIQDIGKDNAEFTTIGVVNKIIEKNITENSAQIEFVLQNDTNKYQNKTTTVRFVSEVNGTSKLLQGQIVDNKVIFDFNNLDKMTTYLYQNIAINISEDPNVEKLEILELSKEFSSFEDKEHISKFTTTSETATVLTVDKINETSSSIELIFSFDKVQDVFMSGKNVSLTYKNKNTHQEITTLTEVVTEDNFLIFKLRDLEQGATYKIISLNLANITINLDSNISEENKNFATSPAVKYIRKNQATTPAADTQMGLTVFFEDGTHRFLNKRAQVTLTSETGEQKIAFSSEITVDNTNQNETVAEFATIVDLTKKTKYTIEEISIDGEVIEFRNNISNRENENRHFTTTSQKAFPISIKQESSTENSMEVAVTFDVNIDPYLLNKNFILKYKKANDTNAPLLQSQPALMNNQGTIIFNLNHTEITSGSLYEIEEIALAELTSEFNTVLEIKQDINNGQSTLNRQISTNSTIKAISEKNIAETSATIKLKLQSEDTSLFTKRAWLSLVNESNQNIILVESTDVIQNDYTVTFTKNSLDKNTTYTILGIGIGNKKSPLLNFDSAIQNSDKSFVTTPTSATIIKSEWKFIDEAKTKVALTLSFDENVDSFMNGKALKLKYKKTAPTVGPGSELIEIAKFNSQNIVVRGSKIQFILQGKIDSTTGNAINDPTEYKIRYNDNSEHRSIYNLPGLIKGSIYTIENLEVVDSNSVANGFIINFDSRVDKTIKTPEGVVDFFVDPFSGIQEVEDGVNAKIITHIMTSDQLTENDKTKFKLKFSNQSTGKYELTDAFSIEEEAIDSYNNLYKIIFNAKLAKQARYSIYQVVKFENDQEIILNKFEKGYIQSGTNGTVNVKVESEEFSTNGRITTINSIELGEFTNKKAKVSIGFVPANENLLRTKNELLVKYRKIGTTSETILSMNSADANPSNRNWIKINPETKKLELEFTNLEEGAEYEIIGIWVKAQNQSNRNGIYIPAVYEHQAIFKSNLSKKFKTKSVIDSFDHEDIRQQSATLKLNMKDQTNFLIGKTGFITIANTNVESEIYTFPSNGQIIDKGNSIKELTFNASGLEKDTTYKFVSVLIDGIIYDKKENFQENTFKTTWTESTITKIEYKELTKNSVKVKIQFSNNDNRVMNGRNIQLNYSNNSNTSSLDSSATVSESGTAEFVLSNLTPGTTYTISNFEDLSASNKATIVLNGLTKTFTTLAIIEKLTITREEQSANLVFEFKEENKDRLLGKVVKLTIDGITNPIIGIVEEDNTDSKLKVKINLSNLNKNTSYTINSFVIEEREIEFETSLNASKTFKTKAENLTIVDIEKTNIETDTGTIKIKLHKRDKFTADLNKQYKLKIKNLTDTTSGSNSDGTFEMDAQPVILENDGTPTITYNLDSTQLNSNKKYQIINLIPEASDTMNLNIDFSNFIKTKNQKAKLFETKLQKPIVTNIRLIETKNDEGEKNTFTSQIEIIFQNPDQSLNEQLINEWELYLSNSNNDASFDNNGTNDYVSDVQFIERRLSNESDGTSKFTFLLKGDVKKWVGIQNKIFIKYNYFDNIEKTNVLTSELIRNKNDNSELTFETTEKVLTERMFGYIKDGFTLEFEIDLYDPSGFVNDVTTSTTPRNDVFNFIMKAKKSILNFKGYGASNLKTKNPKEPSITLPDQLGVWANNEIINGEQITNARVKGQDVSPSYETGMKFKYILTQDWQDFEQYNISKKIISISDLDTNNKTKRIIITIGEDDNRLISKLLQLSIKDMKIQNTNLLFASKNENIAQIIHTMTRTGSTDNWYGSAKEKVLTNNSSRQPNSDKWFLGLANTYNVSGLAGSFDREDAFGIENIEYDEETGKLKTFFGIPQQPRTNVPQGEEQKFYGLSTGTYAMFINSNGDLYYFGGSDGKFLNSLKELKIVDKNNAQKAMLEFDLKSSFIPLDQRPKNGEKLKFVGLIATNFDILNSASPNIFLFMYAWKYKTDSYKEITYKE